MISFLFAIPFKKKCVGIERERGRKIGGRVDSTFESIWKLNGVNLAD